MRQKSGSGSFVAVVRCCIKNLSFSVNALAQSRPDQRGLGDFPKTAVKIALSKSIISTTVGEAGGSGSYKSREEPQFQQKASCNDLSLTGGFVIASGSSLKQTPQVSSRGVRCRAQWVWNTNAHSLRIHTVRVLRLISWTQMGQNPYIALPCTNRCRETSSQSIDLRIHSIGKIGNWCRSSNALFVR
jgi:hypothetical protein